jgi:hypothetical protein
VRRHTVASRSDPADMASQMRCCDMERRFLIGVEDRSADIGRAYMTIIAEKDFCVGQPCSHHQW